MKIILVRHAKSAHDYTRWKTDGIRPLSDVGRNRQMKTSRGMKERGLEFDTIWVSPFLRARQTLDIILDTFDSDISPLIVDELQVWGDPELVMDKLNDFAQLNPSSNLLLVGHNPNISTLVELLTDERIDMSTSDVVVITKNGGWQLESYFPRNTLY